MKVNVKIMESDSNPFGDEPTIGDTFAVMIEDVSFEAKLVEVIEAGASKTYVLEEA